MLRGSYTGVICTEEGHVLELWLGANKARERASAPQRVAATLLPPLHPPANKGPVESPNMTMD